MEASDFYKKRIEQDCSLSINQLMEEYAKHIIEINFREMHRFNFKETPITELEKIHKKVTMCLDWVNE
jgi:hypothetical protein